MVGISKTSSPFILQLETRNLSQKVARRPLGRAGLRAALVDGEALRTSSFLVHGISALNHTGLLWASARPMKSWHQQASPKRRLLPGQRPARGWSRSSRPTDRSRTSREMGTEHEAAAGPGGLPGPGATLKSMKGRN